MTSTNLDPEYARILERLKKSQAAVEGYAPPRPDIAQKSQAQREMEERQEAKRQKWAGVVEERERRRAAEEEKLAPKRAKRERELDHLDRQMADCRKREAELREERRVLAVKPL